MGFVEVVVLCWYCAANCVIDRLICGVCVLRGDVLKGTRVHHPQTPVHLHGGNCSSSRRGNSSVHCSAMHYDHCCSNFTNKVRIKVTVSIHLNDMFQLFLNPSARGHPFRLSVPVAGKGVPNFYNTTGKKTF